ncbi:hypothetical protein AKJ16_DCAP08807 [Drosera capensis]
MRVFHSCECPWLSGASLLLNGHQSRFGAECEPSCELTHIVVCLLENDGNSAYDKLQTASFSHWFPTLFPLHIGSLETRRYILFLSSTLLTTRPVAMENL